MDGTGRRGHAARGFTLFECVVAMGLLALLAGAAAPSAAALLSDWRLNAAARQVALDLRVTRSRAITEHTAHRLRFPASGPAYQPQQQTESASYVSDGPPIPLPSGVRIAHCSAVGESVTFRPRGHATTFGTIALVDARGVRRNVVVDMAGRVRIN